MNEVTLSSLVDTVYGLTASASISSDGKYVYLNIASDFSANTWNGIPIVVILNYKISETNSI